MIQSYGADLHEQEKSKATIEKYLRDIRAFAAYCGNECICKETVIAYKHHLLADGYAPTSINSMLSSINSFFSYLRWDEMKAKMLKIQRQTFCAEEKELSKKEYEMLCHTAEKRKKMRLSLILQTICGTGIRVSELRFITVDAVRSGVAQVSMKGKERKVFLVRDLQKKLRRYIAHEGIDAGPIFVSRSGKAICRTNIWKEMKRLCVDAGVDSQKVFPHNLRHLFARVFYSMEKDIARLADILGHSSIDTTRIYIMETGLEHRRRMENMHLIL